MYLQFLHLGTTSHHQKYQKRGRHIQEIIVNMYPKPSKPSDVDQRDAKAQASVKNWTEKKWLQILPALMSPIPRFWRQKHHCQWVIKETSHLLDITLVDLRVQAPKTSRPFASRCVFRASSSSPATHYMRYCATALQSRSVTRSFCLWTFGCQSQNLHKIGQLDCTLPRLVDHPSLPSLQLSRRVKLSKPQK